MGIKMLPNGQSTKPSWLQSQRMFNSGPFEFGQVPTIRGSFSFFTQKVALLSASSGGQSIGTLLFFVSVKSIE